MGGQLVHAAAALAAAVTSVRAGLPTGRAAAPDTPRGARWATPTPATARGEAASSPATPPVSPRSASLSSPLCVAAAPTA